MLWKWGAVTVAMGWGTVHGRKIIVNEGQPCYVVKKWLTCNLTDIHYRGPNFWGFLFTRNLRAYKRMSNVMSKFSGENSLIQWSKRLGGRQNENEEKVGAGFLNGDKGVRGVDLEWYFEFFAKSFSTCQVQI